MHRHRFKTFAFIFLALFSSAAPSFAATDPDLVGLWHMDGDWTDASGNGNNGTAYNGATFTPDARVGAQAGSFDGVNDYTNVKTSALVSNSAQNSVEAWIYLTAIGTATKTIYAENSSAGVVFSLGVAPTGKPFFAVWRSDVPGNWLTAESGAPVSINQWHHIVGTLDGSGMKIYVNGLLSGTHANTMPSSGAITEASIARINNLGGADFLAGKIDELIVYKRALSAEEIYKSYNAGLGRVAYWRMDGDWTDASGNGNNGTAYNGATFSMNARVGSQAGSFDGADDYVSGSTSGLPSGSSPRTLSAWVKVGSGTQGRAILQYGTGPASSFQLSIDSSNRATVGSSNGTITGTSSLSDGRWHYVVGVYEGSGTNRAGIYVDGVLENSGTIPAPGTVNGGFTIGAFSGGGGYFSGLIDEAAIYNRTLAIDEINKSYNDGLGRIGLWRMDGDWTDASGNGNNGTAYNGTTFSTAARVGSQAGGFDGVNDYVTVKSSAIIANSSQSTIEAWVNPASFGSVRRIYSENSSGGAVFVLSIESAGKAALSIWRTDISGNWVTVTSDTILQLNSWSHVVGTLDASGMKIYVNGVLVGTNTANNLPSNGSITEVVFGRLNNGGGVEYFSGLLDEAAVYNRALTAEEIQAYYNHLTPPTVTISSPLSGVSDNRTPQLTYTVSHGTVTVKVDGIVVNKVSGNALDSLQDGPHTIRVESVNDAGLTGYAEVTYTVQDLPIVTINPVTTPTNVSGQAISGSRSLDSTVTVAVNTTAVAGTVSYPTASTWSCAISNLTEGANAITVTATAPDNQTAVAEASITYYVLAISSVMVSTNTIDTSASGSATIFFTLNGPATATLKIVPEKNGSSGAPIYQTSKNVTAVGAASFTWEGKDSTGKTVSDEAYLYILEATDGVKTATYSPAPPAGTGTVTCSKDSYDPYKNDPLTISYSLSQPARVNLTVNWYGQKVNVMDAAAHAAGSHTFDWDGRNSSGTILADRAEAACTVASLLRENYIITTGDTPKVSNVKTDPCEIQLSYGEFTRIKYTLLSREANMTVKVVSPAGSEITLVSSQLQTAGDHEVEWTGLDPADTTGKKFLMSQEGTYTVSIQAVNPVTGSSSTTKGTLVIRQ